MTYGSALLIEDMENEYKRLQGDYYHPATEAVSSNSLPNDIEKGGKVLPFDQNKRRGTK